MTVRAVAAVVATLCAVALTASCGAERRAAEQRPATGAAQRDAALLAAADLPSCASVEASGPPSGPSPRLTDAALPCLGDGPAVRLSTLHGPLLVNVWASWCEPCRREVPLLQGLAGAAGGRVRVLGVDLESDANTGLRAAAAFGIHYPSVIDPDSRIRSSGVPLPGTPTTYFVDGSGRVTGVHAGAFGSAKQLRADVSRYLGVVVP